jgi:beta-glucosidase
VHELKGFRRIRLVPGETRTVTMRLGPEELKILDINMQWTVEPGAFTVKVGGNQQDVVEGTLKVVKV